MNYRNFHIIERLAWLFPALVLLMSSCSEGEPRHYLADEDASDIEDPVCLRVVLNCSNALQEAPSISLPDETEPGVGYETTVIKATLYLYNSVNKRLYKQIQLNKFTKDESHSDRTSFITDSIVISTGVYDIFVIANCDNLPKNVENECDFLNSIDCETYKNGVIQSLGTKGIVMTSSPGGYLGKELGYSEKGHTINIALERVLSKISISQDNASYTLEEPDAGVYATVNLTNVKIVNAPKKYYLFKHNARLTEYREPEDGYDYFAERDDENDDNVYVIDPCFFCKTATELDSVTLDNYYSEWYKRQDYSFEAPLFSSGKSILYVTENPVYKDVQKKAYVTGLMFKAAVLPGSNSVWYWGTTGPVIESHQEQWPDTLYFYKYKFYISVRDLNRCTGLSLDESKQGVYTDAELKEYKVKQIVKVLGVYQTLYGYWIRHKDNNDENLSIPKEFSIIRNNYYKLHLTRVTGLGNSEADPLQYLDDVEPNIYSDIEFFEE